MSYHKQFNLLEIILQTYFTSYEHLLVSSQHVNSDEFTKCKTETARQQNKAIVDDDDDAHVGLCSHQR